MSHKKVIGLSTLTVLAFLGLLVFATIREGVRNIHPREKTVQIINGDLVLATIRAELADTINRRARGLSGRAELPVGRGMLFVFDHADYYPMWMKEMNFPIDIIWIDKNKIIVDITHEVAPGTYPGTFRPSSPARYVLEIPAGRAVEAGIEVGDEVRI